MLAAEAKPTVSACFSLERTAELERGAAGADATTAPLAEPGEEGSDARGAPASECLPTMLRV
ncbi:hypothetical protein GCM10010196_17130 [Agromyces mediolanus]|uniref:Uncharacterized protein n=1 Tax=Agromyces mediolanus TaxID=41986 RepID=A0A918CIV4_AGRME|nr:hypothetical protein GCM10010196_17130 [Agromyces mediolanus]GLJ71028.1 hypothetical protein GCM10017583_02830 [Agromyces mediolanus]